MTNKKTVSVFTTMSAEGFESYGHKSITSFLTYWPYDCKLFVYCEDFTIKENTKIVYVDIDNIKKLSSFKNKNKNVPMLNGYKNKEYNFMFDFVKFSHKSYVMFDAIQNLTTDWVIWLDADTITHTLIDNDFFNKILNDKSLAVFLERDNLYTETGFLAFNRRHPDILKYVSLAENIYDNNLIFDIDYFNQGYTDCHIFDYVRKILGEEGCYFHNISYDKEDKHPFVNSILGLYMDHLKGHRKELGSSRSVDIKNPNMKINSNYWKNINKKG